MTLRRLTCVAGLLLGALAGAPAAAAPAYSIKAVTGTAPPKELAEPVRKLLEDRCVRLLDGKGTVLAEVWFRKDVPVKATEAQIKNGLTYRELPQSTVVGALRVPKGITDYRKQKIPAGVYTLRYGIQPMDGDHMGTAPYNDFLLASPAADDKKPDALAVKPLQELSTKVTENHPAVFLLFPGKGAAKEPKLVARPGGHQVLLIQLNASSGGKKATLDIGLTLVGASASA